jgi:AraC-like DNA-binding protein
MRSRALLSVKWKNILCFSSVLFLCIVLISATCYNTFSKSYAGALGRENAVKLNALSNQLDQHVYKYVKDQFLSLIENKTFYRGLNSVILDFNPLQMIKIVDAVDELVSIVNFSNRVIKAVDIYCPGSRICISSFSGFMYLDLGPVREDLELWESAISGWDGLFWWGKKAINSYQSSGIICLGMVPNISASEKKAYMAVSLDTGIFSAYLSDLETADEKYYLLDSQFQAVHGSSDELFSLIPGEALLKIASPDNEGKGVLRMYSGDYLVSYIRSTEAPLTLVSVASKKIFRREMDRILLFIIIFAFFTFSVGLGVSGFFTKKLYYPLKSLASKAARLYITGKADPSKNEYSVISKTMEVLSDKVSEYEKIFNDYIKIMRYGFLQSLFNRQFRNAAEISAKAKFLNLEIDFPVYSIIKILLDIKKSGEDSVVLEAYKILSYIESLGAAGVMGVYCVKNTDMSITALLSYGSANIAATAGLIIDYCRGEGVIARVCVSSPCSDLLGIHDCVLQADAAGEYMYFCPSLDLLNADEIKAAGSLVLSSPPSITLLDKFEKSLNDQDLENALKTLDEFRLLCNTLEYRCADLSEMLRSFYRIFQKAAKIHKIEIPGGIFKLEDCVDIDDFCHKFALDAGTAFNLAARERKNRKNYISSDVIHWIDGNFTEPISLDQAAEHFGKSPSWVSKIIREQTGESFVEYLNEKRLDLAMELFKDHSVKVKDAAKAAGFNSAAYFIKRFRLKYGITPNEWKTEKQPPFTKAGALELPARH